MSFRKLMVVMDSLVGGLQVARLLIVVPEDNVLGGR